MEEEFLLKQLVACALINKRGEDAYNSQENDEDEEDEGKEDWDVKDALTSQQRSKGESFKSENLSEIGKDPSASVYQSNRKTVSKNRDGPNGQFEGGE